MLGFDHYEPPRDLHCSRLSDHPPHEWSTPWSRERGMEPYRCSGHVVVEGGSVAARGRS